MTTKIRDVRSYTRRDSATAVLRKLDINPRDYDLFIKKQADDTVTCDVGLAKQHLQAGSRKTTIKAASQRSKKKSVVAKPPKDTISAVARSAILDGKTNDEVFRILQAKFGEERINEDKRNYGAWYRGELRRKGELPPHLDFKRN